MKCTGKGISVFSVLVFSCALLTGCQSENTVAKYEAENYNNNLFFSNISKLKKEDKIYIYDNKKHEYIFSVFANYEVKTDDLSPISSNNFNELTLITCNNINNNRIIIKGSF